MQYAIMFVGLCFIALLIGYLLGRRHQKKVDIEKVPTFLVRPHTSKTIEDYPLPEESEQDATITDAQWARTDLPNSGVRWS